MLSLPPAVRIFVCTQLTDGFDRLTTSMRYGFDRLAMLAETVLGQDPFSGHLFVFFNRRGDRCKILFWDRTGFCLYYKRLEQGVFHLPDYPADTGTLEVNITDLALILEGIDLTGARRYKRYVHVSS
jgi:transposase